MSDEQYGAEQSHAPMEQDRAPPPQESDYRREEDRTRDNGDGQRSPEASVSRRGSASTSIHGEPPRKPANAPVPEPTTVVGVFGLSIRTVERDLEEVFEKSGKVVKCVVVYDQRTDRSRGFGFVTMATIEDAERAIADNNGLDLHGRRIRVDFSATTRPHDPTPGQYRGPQRFDDFSTRGGGGYSRGGGGFGGGDRWASGGGGGDRWAPQSRGGNGDRWVSSRGGGDRYGGDRGGDRWGSNDRYGGGRDSRDSYRGGDRYGGGGRDSRDERDDRYAPRRDDRDDRDRRGSDRRSRSPLPPSRGRDYDDRDDRVRSRDASPRRRGSDDRDARDARSPRNDGW